MKKVLVFGMTENPGGVESVIMNYYRNIHRDLVQFDFLCNSQEVAYEEEIRALGGQIYKIPARRDGRQAFYAALEEFMKIHASEYRAIWVNVCSLANIDYLIAAKKYGIPKRIIHCHNADNGDSFLRGILHKMNRMRVQKYATDFWTCSDAASDWFFGKKIKNDPRYQLVYNGVVPEQFAPNAQIRDQYRSELGVEGKIVIGHIGRFHFQKNHRFLIDVFRELKKRDSRYVLLLIGQGELTEEVREQVKNYGLEDSVQFLGVRTDVARLYQAMDLFVFPSVFEGIPVVLLEAQANGLPTVVSDRVTDQVKVMENLYFLGLDQGTGKWAEFIDKNCKGQKRLPQQRFLDSPYNICNQAADLEASLLS